MKVSSISALHQFLGLQRPSHPLISVFNFDDVKLQPETILQAVTTDFYVVALKKDCAGGKYRYGQHYYDFEEGIMYFMAPHQVSPNYLSDMLRVQTGQTTQQHIQNRVIEKAKELLSVTGMTVSEITYELGFEHPHSFHRLFKNRTSVSPLEFRASFN